MALRRLRLATRGSPLALAQVDIVAAALARTTAGEVLVERVIVETRPDRSLTVPIHRLGGRGLFVSEVEQAVSSGRADAAVHSAKDVPSSPELSQVHIAAVLARDDPRDCLVGLPLSALPAGARVATGSIRRRAQLAWLRPDLSFGELRGNIGTRLSKLPSSGAIVTAVAAMRRLGLEEDIAEVLSTAEMLPQVGQGTIVVSCRADDPAACSLLREVDDERSRIELAAERAFLAAAGGGCDLPIGAYARVLSECGAGTPERLRLEAMVASHDGHVVVRASSSGPVDDSAADYLGRKMAQEVLERRGGADLLGWDQ